MATKTLLQIVQQACAEMNLPTPTQVLSSTDQNVLKMAALVRAVCDDLLAEFDWQQLQTRYSFSTVNGQEAYTLPTDIERFINGTFFDQNNRWPLRGPKTPSEWEFLKVGLFNGVPFTRFRIYNGQFFVSPTPGTNVYTFVFEYISRNYVRGSGNTPQNDFLADSDTCLFDHRMLVYGLKLKWLASIGQDTTAALTDYNRALSFNKSSNSPAPRLSLAPAGAYPMISSMNFPDGNWTV